MRAILDMDTVQIEITNACTHSCANCSRFCGSVIEPFFMTWEEFKQAVDSMVGYPKMTGIQGGEPLLHPEFEKFCEYLAEKIPYAQRGLWTTLPKGYEKYREIICKTFKHIFVNNHTRPDIYHHPPLVAVKEAIPDDLVMWQAIDHCWAQMSWSASIYPHGAWFCEVAGSFASFLQANVAGWLVEPKWWMRIPADFREQMQMFCPMCGFPATVRRRSSQERNDDISQGNYEYLSKVGCSRKVKNGLYEIYDFSVVDKEKEAAPLGRYKDTGYRNQISSHYGIFLLENDQRFWTPFLADNWDFGDRRSTYEIFKEKYGV